MLASGAAATSVQHQDQGQPSASPIVEKDDRKRKRSFAADLHKMMYGFGDHECPLSETVDLLDDIIHDFVTNMTKGALALGERKGEKKISKDKLLFLIRKHPKMLFRARELIAMDKEISDRKVIDIEGMPRELPKGNAAK